MKEMKLELGLMAASIEDQLNAQELPFYKSKTDVFEKDREALNRLRIRGIITNSESNNGYKKLFNNIKKYVTDIIND